MPPEGKITAAALRARKGTGERIAVLTAYDVVFAGLADRAGIDAVLVGDSLGMVVQGERSTLSVRWSITRGSPLAVSRAPI
jgi:3-methyl-2-oxobutanoate hydroxymethyltransferase